MAKCPRFTVIVMSLIALFPVVSARAGEGGFDYTRDKVLHVVGTAHLDTQWRWTIQKTIGEYIPNTLRRNFALFEIYPHYTFSFEGAFRYMLAREYYPRDYARLKRYIELNRWAVCGSSVVAGDVNVPSPEAIIRNILYGNGFFKREFGKTSRDIFLPDCFGFGYALPTIASHCGLRGFSSQKLTWGSAVGIPFDIGVWEGVDGSGIVAALNPDPYVSRIRHDLSSDERWVKTVEEQGKKSGLYVGYKYFGVGDVGGAPDNESVEWLEKSINGSGPLRVVSAPADRLFREITPEQMKHLPRYRGELLMTTHGTGCYTSQHAMKRWNRKNELLADSAERASVAAAWLGGITYPRKKLRESWIRFIWHQFHDDLTGTSIPEAYEFSWNDEIISLNRFSAVLEDAAGAVARALDTMVDGRPLVVFNPLAMDREDAVEAEVVFPEGGPAYVRVFGPDGSEVPSQIIGREGGRVKVLFLARVPSVGFAVFDVRPSDAPCSLDTGLSVTERSLENGRYLVEMDENGDIARITDKVNGRELLDAPIRLALFRDESRVWPAWEITYDTVSADPVDYVGGPVAVRVLESGPVRVSVQIVRKNGKSTFTQVVRLVAGSDRIECGNLIDWRSKGRLLKAVFPLSVSNPRATYDLGIGTIERGNNTEKLYEVPAQKWADITDVSGEYGVTVMNDCLYGWDKPGDGTLRLTMLHTPVPGSYEDQAMQDIGRHRMGFAVMGHAGDWRSGGAVREAARLNQPLVAFRTDRHDGFMGRSFSFMSVDTGRVAVKALKLAEESDEIVVRLVETEGRSCEARVSFAFPVLTAREVNGMEEPVGDAVVRDGKLVVEMEPYRPRTFAVTIGYPDAALSKPISVPVEIPFDIDVVSRDDDTTDGDMDGKGHTLAGELLPEVLVCEGIPFALGSSAPGEKNALVCRGQTVQLPPRPRRGDYDRLYVLAAAVGGDTRGTFAVGDRKVEVGVQDFTGFIGQWDDRLIDGRPARNVFQVRPGFIKRDRLAWVGTHRHSERDGDEPYVFTYIYRYTIELPPRCGTVTLPVNENIRIFAMTAAVNFNDRTEPAHPLYDEERATSVVLEDGVSGYFIDELRVALRADPPDAVMHYTLDGGEPTRDSPVYTAPFRITENTTLKAIAFHDEIEDNRLMVVDFEKLTPLPPAKTGRLKPGLSYRVYHGDWNRLPDFRRLKPVKRGVIEKFAIPEGTRDDRFAVSFTGYIDVPADGVYTFATRSDDGSRLYLDGRLLVDNDGLHGVQEKEGTVALKAGKHKISVGFFEKGGGQDLEVYYEGPGIPRREIDASALWH